MAQNEMRRLVLGFFLIFTVVINGVAGDAEPSAVVSSTGVAAEAEPEAEVKCAIKCSIRCIFKKKKSCFSDCMRNCLHKDVSECTFSCIQSSCMNFISDDNKLEGCVGSCNNNCGG